jgi:uncharacterized membrane protein
MGTDACFDKAMDLLDQQLQAGEITREEYKDAIRQLEHDVSEMMRDGEW